MGSSSFTAYASGATPEEAFKHAVRDAKYDSGHGGYTGTIAEKEGMGLLEITVPAEYKGKEQDYVEMMKWDRNPRIADKFGPTGYIKLRSYDKKEYVPDKVKRHHMKTNGARKWESLYLVYASTDEGTIQVEFSKFKDDAVKKAIAYTKEYGYSTSVVLEKRLINQDPVVFTANMSYKEVLVKAGRSDYVFFGMASD